MDTLYYFLNDAVAIKVLIGVFIIAATSAVVGTFSFLRKKTLIGDAIAHALLPGICIGFMLTGVKNPVWILTGAVVSGWISVWAIEFLSMRTKLSEDTSIALVSTSFFAIGSVLLSIISKSDNGNQSGLKDFLFGKAATLTETDIQVFGVLSIIILSLIIVYYKPFKLISFNRDFAQATGWNVKRIEFLLATITVVTVAIAIQAVGVVLTSALLIAPASAARYWTNSLPKMIVLAALIGMFSGGAGVLISASQVNMPTGPWIVFVLFFFTLFTLLFSPQKGWLSTVKKQKANRKKINEENVLKIFFQLNEKEVREVSYRQFLERRQMDPLVLTRTINALIRKNWLREKAQIFELTELGRLEAARVVRFHRLWELYLTKRLNFKEDHIHGTAETIEHLITPEIEALLLKDLDFPETDPHDSEIPY